MVTEEEIETKFVNVLPHAEEMYTFKIIVE